MRMLVVAGLWFVAPLCAQSYSLADLDAADWQVRNRAASALAVAKDLDQRALLAAITREAASPLPPLPEPSGRWGARIQPDAVEECVAAHRDGVADRHFEERPLPHPVTVRDLVVPFDARVLAAFVAVEQQLDPTAVGEACVALLRLDDPRTRTAVASILWRLGSAVEPMRARLLRVPGTAGLMARLADEGGPAAGAEIAAALRAGDADLRTALLDGLRVQHARTSAELLAAVVHCFLRDSDDVSLRAGAVLRDCGTEPVRALAEALADEATAARAAGMLFVLGVASLPEAKTLLRAVVDAEFDLVARTRAAFALGELGSELERTDEALATEVAATLFAVFSDGSTKGEFGLAVTYAMGGYEKTLPAVADKKLEAMIRAWLPRIRHGKLAAVHALCRSERLASLPLDLLQSLWHENRRARLRSPIEAAMAMHGEKAEPALRALVEEADWWSPGRSAARHVAPMLRRWLDDADVRFVRAGLQGLLALGDEAGVEFARARAIAEGGGPEAVSTLAVTLAANLPKDAAGTEWVVEQLVAREPTSQTIEQLLALGLERDRLEAVLTELLAKGDAWAWRALAGEPDLERSLAVSMLRTAEDGAARIAESVLARCGPRTEEEVRLLLRALERGPTTELLVALTEAPQLSDSLRKAVAAALSPSDGEQAEAAVNCLWRHR